MRHAWPGTGTFNPSNLIILIFEPEMSALEGIAQMGNAFRRLVLQEGVPLYNPEILRGRSDADVLCASCFRFRRVLSASFTSSCFFPVAFIFGSSGFGADCLRFAQAVSNQVKRKNAFVVPACFKPEWQRPQRNRMNLIFSARYKNFRVSQN